MPRGSLKKKIGRAREEQRRLIHRRRAHTLRTTEEARAAMLEVARIEDIDGDRRAHQLAMLALVALTDLREYQEKRA